MVYDPALTVGLPPQVTGPSAFNALAHCVEALYATGCNPVTSAMALEGVRAIQQSLPRVMEAPGDLDARGDVLYGAYLAGIALGTTSTGLHHKLCHVLGGMFNLVHADTHSIILAACRRVQRSRAAGRDGAPRRGARRGSGRCGWRAARPRRREPRADAARLSSGLTEADLHEAAVAGAAEITTNPVPVTVDDLDRLLQHAYEGTRPERRV